MKHAAVFMFRAEPQVMKLSDFAIPIVQENCIRCHEGQVSEILTNAYPNGEQRCWDCHREVVHGRVHSLSASPDVSRPNLPSVLKMPPIPSMQDVFGKGQEEYVPLNVDNVVDSE
jgi:cytochrome c nitrite reductase small subunit